jgi:hypothetical protein
MVVTLGRCESRPSLNFRRIILIDVALKRAMSVFRESLPGSPVAPSQFSSRCRQLHRSLRDRLDTLVMRGLALKPESRYPDHNTWLNEWQELSARFHITPELLPIENALTRVIGWFMKSDHDRKRSGGS